jgi:diguanylate cyclase (GGDEF)-like protein
VERTLRRDLDPSARVVRASSAADVPPECDVAVLFPGTCHPGLAGIRGVPTVVVCEGAHEVARTSLVERGIQESVSPRCATCSRDPSLASALRWAIERTELVQKLERSEARARSLALRDELTGLPNTRGCRERCRQLLAQSRRTGKGVAVLFLDLDSFKDVNDAYGHAAGDRLLRQVAERVAGSVRETDTVARRGGDEFIVLLDDVHGTADALRVARKVARAIAAPCLVGGDGAPEERPRDELGEPCVPPHAPGSGPLHALRPSASIGVALHPEHGASWQALERAADLAMYAAKELGGGRIRLASAHSGRIVRPPEERSSIR